MAINITFPGYNWFKRQRIFHWSLSVLSLVTLLFISGKYPLKFPEFWNKNFFVLILSLLLLSRFLRQCHQCVFVKITNLGPKNATFSEKSTTTFKKAPWKPLLWRYLTYKWSGFSENRRVHATWPGLCDWLICLAGDLKNNNFFSFSHQQGSLISFLPALVSTKASLHAS